ncbi:hypothetical protein Vadar_001713 [Vaccinium darrowii]|uniref:Uncharacterized protein n=1 Tax=Vaccinium darrowii TaxID=229202 RepID=A0ACB7ZH75_9ERIC|nr:hypothetical protein Vadar_001713 [Vaccinium darrowii]
MGAGSSQFAASDWDESGNPSTRPRFEDIPENCIALVLTRLDLTEIWKLARLNLRRPLGKFYLGDEIVVELWVYLWINWGMRRWVTWGRKKLLLKLDHSRMCGLC